MDSRAFLDAARAALSDGKLMDSQGRISNDALFAAIEARLGVGRLPRRTWAKHLSFLGLKPARWDHGKVRGWRLSDVTPVDVTPVDVTPVDALAGHPRCRVRLPNPEAAGYTTKEALLEAVEKYPHLRPCPKKNWWWLEWKYCEKCDWKVSESLAATEQRKTNEKRKKQMKNRKVLWCALLGLFFLGLSYGVLAPKAEAAFFTECPERNQIVPLSPMMNPEYAATVEKANRENISFEEARAREHREREIRTGLAAIIGLLVFFGAIRMIPPLVRGTRKSIGRGIISVDNARQKMKRTSLRDIGERLANENNRRLP